MWAGIYLAVIIAVLVGRYMSMEEEKYIEREITPPKKNKIASFTFSAKLNQSPASLVPSAFRLTLLANIRLMCYLKGEFVEYTETALN